MQLENVPVQTVKTLTAYLKPAIWVFQLHRTTHSQWAQDGLVLL